MDGSDFTVFSRNVSSLHAVIDINAVVGLAVVPIVAGLPAAEDGRERSRLMNMVDLQEILACSGGVVAISTALIEVASLALSVKFYREVFHANRQSFLCNFSIQITAPTNMRPSMPVFQCLRCNPWRRLRSF